MTTVPFRQKKSAAALISDLRARSDAPISAMIEIADRCNEVCVHCYQVHGEKGELRTEDWKSILDELAAMGVVFLTVSGGEATLRRDLVEIIAHARRLRFAVKLFTNGLNVTPELARTLADLAVQEVQISLYSHDPTIHDGVTRVPGSWEKSVNAARYCIAAGMKVVLKTPLMAINADDVDAYIDFVTGLGADYTMDPHLDPRENGDRAPLGLAPDDAALLRARRHPALRGPGRLPTNPRSLDGSVCGACRGNVHIEPNGELRACTQLTVPLGNATKGIREAWATGATAVGIRQLTWADLHGCRDCDLRSYCGRCFANAQQEGDALGPHSAACRRAKHSYEIATGELPRIEPSNLPGRDESLGPYREVAPATFRCIEDVVTAADRARAERLGWVRPSGLVQIQKNPRAGRSAAR